MSKLKNQNWIMIISLVLWCAITFIRLMHHSPWSDEAHAWLISQELNILEIIKLMRIEGHTFLWYLVLMPFAKTNFMYPYSMLMLNWLFCFIAILILWLKSPFNNWIKFLISFSFPFLALYPVVARCYSIGIMLLFALTALEKSKLKHPSWYALLLILCANTSLMAIVGATVFGVIFIYELIKNKKSLLIPFIIMSIGAFLVLIQLLGASNMVGADKPFSLNFFKYLIFSNIYINLGLLVISGILLTVFYVKNKILPKFLILSYLILFLTNCVYAGTHWHHFFYYIYFIISCWLLKERNVNYKYDYIIFSLLIIISFVLFFYKADNSFYLHVIGNNSKYSASIIKNDDKLKDANFIVYSLDGYELYPYLKFSDMNFINYCSGEKLNYDTKYFYRSEYCEWKDFYHIYYDFYQYDKLLKKNKNFVFGEKNLKYLILYADDKNYKIVFNSYKKLTENLYIYSIEKK